MSSNTAVPYPLGQSVGYGVVVGLGVAFAIGMVLLTRQLKKSFGEDNNTTETYMVANRSVGTGLTASAVISSWLFSSALLGAPYLTYWYGVSVSVWWAVGQSTMIAFFGYLAIHAKLKAPNAHTLLEVIKLRYGTGAHLVWIFLCLLNNTLNFASMLVGAATAVSSLTGMNVIAGLYLLPLGVVVYTYFGGLRATFLTDYIHTFIVLIIVVWLTFRALGASGIGSLGSLYDAIVPLSKESPVEGNYKGSYLTMTSQQSIYFGIIHVVTNFGIVFLDTGFWQKGFAANVAAAVPGYIIGGNAYFAIPWAFGTIIGLGALALEKTPSFPTYPRRMTHAEVSGGLVLPYVSQAIAGKGGAGAVLVIIFMTCTSVTSAQLIAMSSILSFDIYGTYINQHATNAQIIRWSHYGVVGSALIISSVATGLHSGGVDLNWLIYFLGIVICPGTWPTAFALLWKKQTKAAAIISPLLGMACGLGVWIGTAYHYSGRISVESLGGALPCVFGTVTSSFVPLPTTIIISLVWPHDGFEWSQLLDIKRVKVEDDNTSDNLEPQSESSVIDPDQIKYMKRMSRIALYWGIFTFIAQFALWPLIMYGSKYIFSKKFFMGWAAVAIIWLFIALLIATLFPLIDGGFKAIWNVLRGRTAEPYTTTEHQEVPIQTDKS